MDLWCCLKEVGTSVEPPTKDELAAVGAVHDDPTSDTVCKKYQKVTLLSDEQKSELQTMCTIHDADDQVTTILQEPKFASPIFASIIFDKIPTRRLDGCLCCHLTIQQQDAVCKELPKSSRFYPTSTESELQTMCTIHDAPGIK